MILFLSDTKSWLASNLTWWWNYKVLCELSFMYLCSLPASASKFIDDNHEPLFSSCSNMWPMRISGQVYNLIWNLDIGVLIIITDSRLVSKPALTENVGIGPTFNFFQISHLEFEVKRKCVTLRLIALKSEDRWQIQRKPAEIISAESFVWKLVFQFLGTISHRAPAIVWCWQKPR